MSNPELVCLFFADLPQWERSQLEKLISSYFSGHKLTLVDITASDQGYLKQADPNKIYWVVSKNWHWATGYLKASKTKAKVFVSVLDGTADFGSSLFSLLWNSLFPLIPKNVHLLVHSEWNQLFFSEMRGIRNDRLHFLPLTCVDKPEKTVTNKSKAITVGIFCPFIASSGLNYILSVAHYVSQKNEQVRFLVLGTGILYSHLHTSIRELGLESSVSVIETESPDAIAGADLFLYAPYRNDHFLPLFYAGLMKVPVVSTQVEGIHHYLFENQFGFDVSPHDVKLMGEIILRLNLDEALRLALAEKQQSFLQKKYSHDDMKRLYHSRLYNLENREISSELRAA